MKRMAGYIDFKKGYLKAMKKEPRKTVTYVCNFNFY